MPIAWGGAHGEYDIVKSAYVHSDLHGMAAVRTPWALRREGVGWWSRGGRGGGRAWGGTLHWKQK